MAAEKNFETKVKTFLKDEGCWHLKTWSNGVQRSGIPDLLVCCNGHFVGVELKAPNGTPSELQKYNLRQIEEAGGYAVLLYPCDFELFKGLINALNSGFEKNAQYFNQELRKQLEKYLNEERKIRK